PVPAIAPATPAGRSVIEAPFDAPIAAPQSAPLTSRVTKLTGALRLGVFGSLSTTNSPIAATLKMYGVPANPKKASRVFSKCSNLKRAAQLTAAGAVIERSPATMPIRSAETYLGTVDYFITERRLDQKLGNSNSLMLRYAFTNNREASEAFNSGDLINVNRYL